MKFPFALTIAVIFFSRSVFSQRQDTLLYNSDTTLQLTKYLDSSESDVNKKISARQYFNLLARDFKQQVTTPFHMSRKDWAKFGIFAAGTISLMLVDEPMQQFAVGLRNRNTSLRQVSSYVTKFGGLYEAYALVGLGTYGFVFKNEKMQTTTLLATQSYITSAAMVFLLKTITGRQRPSYYDPFRAEAEPTFRGPFFHGGRNASGKRINTSFPSGHTTATFSVATVYAMEYRNKPWVPILSYATAGLVGLSRIAENKHWFTDVLVGATLGYLTGKQVVKNYHRYSTLKYPEQKKNTLSFNLRYDNGVIMPGLVYKFH